MELNITTKNGRFTDAPEQPVIVQMEVDGQSLLQGSWFKVRPFVAALALFLEYRLSVHDYRPGWETLTSSQMYLKLDEEIKEFDDEWTRRVDGGRGNPALAREAMDVIAVLGFIIQKHGTLDPLLAALRGGDTLHRVEAEGTDAVSG